MVGVFFVLLVLWLFISQWLCVIVFVLVMVVWLVVSLLLLVFILWFFGQFIMVVVMIVQVNIGVNVVVGVVFSFVNSDILLQIELLILVNLINWLNVFYVVEQKCKMLFLDQLLVDVQLFDLLVINICFFFWLDIEVVGLMDYLLWKYFDIVFKNFNFVIFYSGLVVVCLLCVSCGQLLYINLYQLFGVDCYLFENLVKFGFNQQLMFGYNGLFGDFLKELCLLGGMQSLLMDQIGLLVSLQVFDGFLVYKDLVVFNCWLKIEEVSSNLWNVIFYNILLLYDGNYFLG